MAKKSFSTRAKQYTKKTAKKIYKYAKKRYTSKGRLNLKQISSDVYHLKKLVNAEKKSTNDQSTDYRVQDQGIAQLNTQIAGYHIKEISPSGIIQGNNYDERSGNSIKLHSLVIKGQVRGQISLNNKMKLIVEVWHRKAAASAGTSTVMNELFDDNAFLTPALIDYNSSRDKFHFKDYRRVGYKHLTMAADTLSTQITQVANFTIPMKLNQHATWSFNGNYISPYFYITVRADTGNYSATGAGTVAGVPTNSTNTGAIISYSWQYFYYDN